MIAPPAETAASRPDVRDWKRRATLFLAILGPGIITANVDNDAGGIATYSIAGAHFGYSLLWTLVPITIALIVVQEMSARLGAVTGKGLGELIRENYGLQGHVLPARRPSRDGHREHRRRVRRLGGGARDLRDPALRLRSDRRVRRVVARREGQLQDRREGLPDRLHRLPDVHPVGALRETRLEGRPQADLRAPDRVERRVDPDDHRPRRHDDRALDAVLPPGVDRREADRPRGIQALALGRHRRLRCSRRSSPSSSSSPAARRSSRAGSASKAPSEAAHRARAARGKMGEDAFRASASRTRRSSRRPSCLWPRPTPSARGSASRPA